MMRSIKSIAIHKRRHKNGDPNNMNTFFDEITTSLSKAAMENKNIIIMGDLNIDIKNKGLGYA